MIIYKNHIEVYGIEKSEKHRTISLPKLMHG